MAISRIIPTPFYVVSSGGIDLTKYISRLTFEDCLDQDDIVRLSMDGAALHLLDDGIVVSGKELNFKFGFLGGLQSGMRVARVSNVSVSYGPTIQVSVTATDFGIVTKKSQTKKVWEKLKASDIVGKVADTYGLKKDIVVTSKVYDSYAQSGMSDWDMVKDLAKKEDCIFYVKEKTLFFKKRDLNQTPKASFIYNGPNGTIISFRVDEKDTAKSGSDTKASFYDPVTKQETTVSSGNGVLLGKKPASYNFLGNRVDKETNAADLEKNLAGTFLGLPSGAKDEAKNLVDSLQKNSSLGDITASLILSGSPFLEADMLITVLGVAKLHSGNWYVNKAVHKIDSGGYTTTLELLRNGSNQTGQTSGDIVNDKKGPENADTTRTIKKYDPNGKLIPN